jgi:hypothetical protein
MMDLSSAAPILIFILVCAGLLFWLSYRVRAGRSVNLRPLNGYDALRAQRAKSVETGRGVHFSVGRANLSGSASPTSMAALSSFDYIASDACASDVPPVTTTGDGSLLLAAQDSLRAAYDAAGRPQDYSPQSAQYLAAENQAMTYAAGASDIVNQGELGSNLMIGRFGAEIAIVAESAERGDMEQVLGSDDPTAMALAVVATDKVLLGEEVFVSGAYLHGEAEQLASIHLQDILRVMAIVGILLATLFYLVVG